MSLLEKLDIMRKLVELRAQGVHLSQNYTVNSDYATMVTEYELHIKIIERKRAVEWLSSMLILSMKGVELLNDAYNPFDVKFKNSLSTSIQQNISMYHDVLEELYDKHKNDNHNSNKKMSPELRLTLMLTGNIISAHIWCCSI